MCYISCRPEQRARILVYLFIYVKRVILYKTGYSAASTILQPSIMKYNDMVGRWVGELVYQHRPPEILEVTIDRNRLKALRDGEAIVDHAGGTWDSIDNYLIYDKARTFYVREATADKLVFGRFKGPQWVGVANIDWQSELKRAPTTSSS